MQTRRGTRNSSLESAHCFEATEHETWRVLILRRISAQGDPGVVATLQHVLGFCIQILKGTKQRNLQYAFFHVKVQRAHVMRAWRWLDKSTIERPGVLRDAKRACQKPGPATPTGPACMLSGEAAGTSAERALIPIVVDIDPPWSQ